MVIGYESAPDFLKFLVSKKLMSAEYFFSWFEEFEECD